MLSAVYPDIAKEWHPTKNGNLTPDKIRKASGRKVWWLCPISCDHGCLHEYESTVCNITNGIGCPFCCLTPKQICYHQSLAFKYPDVAEQWHPDKNGALEPSDVTPQSSRKVWWLCPNKCLYGCVHEYESRIADKTGKHSECPFCSRSHKQICYHQSLAFIYPDVAVQWHPDKNGTNIPSICTSKSSTKVWWKCSNHCEFGCSHEYQQTIAYKTTKNSSCPEMCYHESLSYKYPTIAEQWHPTKNGDLTPDKVSCFNRQKVWWLCNVGCKYGCVHEYQATIGDKTTKNSACPFCSKMALKKCYHQSLEFNFPEIAKEWHYEKNGNMKPCDVSCGVNTKAWWRCSQVGDHEWIATIANRTRTSNPSRCPKCFSKYSQISLSWIAFLQISNPCEIIHALSDGGEYRVPDTRFQADGYCKETNTVYEFHGDYYHGNPNVSRFSHDKINPTTKTTFGELYQKTQDKKYRIQEMGYNYVEIWEHDWIRAVKLVTKIQRIWRSKHQ